jgi:hypothetical protein
VTTDRLIADLRQTLSPLADFDGPLTDAQQSAIFHAIAEATAGKAPDVICLVQPGDGVLYAIYWVSGAVFGALNVMNIDRNDSGAPKLEGWVRPTAEVARIDLRVDVRRASAVVGDFDVRLDATIHWKDGETPVRLDGTSSGNHFARDATLGVIRALLARVGTEVGGPS